MWHGNYCYLQSDQKLMFTFVFYCRCLGVWRNADIHCWVNVDDVICKVRLVFRNCVEISNPKSVFGARYLLFAVMNTYKIQVEVLVQPKYSYCLPCHNNNNSYNVCYMKLCILLQSILDSVISGNFQWLQTHGIMGILLWSVPVSILPVWQALWWLSLHF